MSHRVGTLASMDACDALDALADDPELAGRLVHREVLPERVARFADLTSPLPEEVRQRIEARGTFDAEHQFVVRYRSNGDTEGYEVVTPLRTATGAVLVDRGFIPLERGAQIPTAAPAPPTGEVTVIGHVRRDERGRRAATTPVGNQMRLINSNAIAATLPYPITSGYIGLLTVEPQQPGGFQPIQLPELSEGPHFWYAVQWFMFTAVAVAGIVVFIRSDLRARREERDEAAQAHVTV